MWYRDPALAQIHVAELAGEAAKHRLARPMVEAATRRRGLRRTARVTLAVAIRATGRAVLAVAERIDDACTTDTASAQSMGDIAYHRS